MRSFLLIVLILVIVLGFYYYRYDKLPFDFSLAPLAECDAIVAREKPSIIETATSISVTKNEYLDGIHYFFKGCFLRD